VPVEWDYQRLVGDESRGGLLAFREGNPSREQEVVGLEKRIDYPGQPFVLCSAQNVQPVPNKLHCYDH